MSTLRKIIIFSLLVNLLSGCAKYLVNYRVCTNKATSKVYIKQHDYGEIRTTISSSGLARNDVNMLLESHIENNSAYELYVNMDEIAIHVLSNEYTFEAFSLMSSDGQYFSNYYGKIAKEDSISTLVIPPGVVKWIRVEGNILDKDWNERNAIYGKELIKEIGLIDFTINEIVTNDVTTSIEVTLAPVKQVLFLKTNLANCNGSNS